MEENKERKPTNQEGIWFRHLSVRQAFNSRDRSNALTPSSAPSHDFHSAHPPFPEWPRDFFTSSACIILNTSPNCEFSPVPITTPWKEGEKKADEKSYLKDSVTNIREKTGGERTHFSLPISHQGPHENNIAQCGYISSFQQHTISLVARLSFSCKTGFIHQQICNLNKSTPFLALVTHPFKAGPCPWSCIYLYQPEVCGDPITNRKIYDISRHKLSS